MRESHSEILINRLATNIVDESLPLKEVERELRSLVADIAVRQRGLNKREAASRCGVTEKSIENYLKESRVNPKSPDREMVRILQDQTLSLEEVHEVVFPLLVQGRDFTLDDAKRTMERLVRTGEVREEPGRRYRAAKRSAIRCPKTSEAYRDLVDQKARDMDYIILKQMQVQKNDLAPEKVKSFSRVVGDTNFLRIDFTADVPQEHLEDFYEKISAQIAKLTMRYEKKKGKCRLRLLLGMRTVAILLATCLMTMVPNGGGWSEDESWELDNHAAAPEDPTIDQQDSWELDYKDDKAVRGDERYGTGADHSPKLDVPLLFVRGDVNSDLDVNVTDAIGLLRYHFLNQPIHCEDAADVDDNGALEVRDPLELLRYLFDASHPPVSDLGLGPVTDQTADDLGCEVGLEVEE